MTTTGFSIPVGLSAGVLSAHFIFANLWPLWPIASMIVVLWLFKRNSLLVAILIGFCWNSYCLSSNLNDRLDAALKGSTHTVTGKIVGLPKQSQEYSRFVFSPNQKQQNLFLPSKILTYWYRDPPVIEPGQSWNLELHLKPPWGRVNFSGPDRELWLFSQKIGALATVRSGELVNHEPDIGFSFSAWRLKIRNHLLNTIDDPEPLGLVSSLAIADRSFLQPSHNETLKLTGTSHLLAISGLHIGLAAFCGLWLTRLLTLLMPTRVLGSMTYPITLSGGLLFAFTYAAMAGFGTSTQRALIMLSVGVLALVLRRSIHPMHAISCALALVLMINPLSALGSGLWLSFGAVSVLLIIFSQSRTRDVGRWRNLLTAQMAIMLFMLPLSAWWFGASSIMALPANLVAIPWVSFVVVPLVLFGMLLYPLSEVLSAQVLIWAGESASFLMAVLEILAGSSISAIFLSKPAFWILLVSSLGALLLLLPQGLRARSLGLAMMLPIFAAAKTDVDKEMQLDFLDIGQGTAVLLSSRQHLMLYDSGPGDGIRFDHVDEVIRPAVFDSGHSKPDMIVISHGDLDHAGGLQTLQSRYPQVPFYASLSKPREGMMRCDTTFESAWLDVQLSVLHPGPHLPYLGNDSSCVVSIKSRHFSVLLAGDISQTVEQRLIQQGIGTHDVMLVPHHGSKSSSSAFFISKLKPSLAIATTGLGNRFGFPAESVKQRYLRQEAHFLSTESCGGVRVNLLENGRVTVQTARQNRPRPWRWNAGLNCPKAIE